jgi:hypothetical protein
MQEGQVVARGFLVAGRNAPVMLDAAEKPFDFVVVFVKILIDLTLGLVGFRDGITASASRVSTHATKSALSNPLSATVASKA